MLVNPDDKQLMHDRKVARIQLPVLHRRQDLCLERVSGLPGPIAWALVLDVARRDDPRLAPYAYGAAAGSRGAAAEPDASTTAAMLETVRGTPDPGIRLLALHALLRSGSADSVADATRALHDLAAAGDTDGARFAVRAVSRLPSGSRASILDAAGRHADADIRRLASLHAPLR
jgi:hypothetical protein